MIILSFSAARPPGPAAAAGKFFFRAGKAAKNAKKRLTSAELCDRITKPPEKGGLNGGLAQLGEHLPYKQRVTGSSPVVPTNSLAS